MAAASGSTVSVTSSEPVLDQQQWWADVQNAVASLLTEAARPVVEQRRAG